MAPIGVIGLCAHDGHGDLATARAAAATGVPMVASTLTVGPMEDVAKEFGGTPGFFQLYTPNDRDLAAGLVSRAEAAGFKGVVVTLDTWLTPTCDDLLWPSTATRTAPTSPRSRCTAPTPVGGRSD